MTLTKRVTLFVVPPNFEAKFDALQAVIALKKEFPQSDFSVVDDEGDWIVAYDAMCNTSGAVIDGVGLTYRKAFTKGFMSSAHLWER